MQFEGDRELSRRCRPAQQHAADLQRQIEDKNPPAPDSTSAADAYAPPKAPDLPSAQRSPRRVAPYAEDTIPTLPNLDFPMAPWPFTGDPLARRLSYVEALVDRHRAQLVALSKRIADLPLRKIEGDVEQVKGDVAALAVNSRLLGSRCLQATLVNEDLLQAAARAVALRMTHIRDQMSDLAGACAAVCLPDFAALCHAKADTERSCERTVQLVRRLAVDEADAAAMALAANQTRAGDVGNETIADDIDAVAQLVRSCIEMKTRELSSQTRHAAGESAEKLRKKSDDLDVVRGVIWSQVSELEQKTRVSVAAIREDAARFPEGIAQALEDLHTEAEEMVEDIAEMLARLVARSSANLATFGEGASAMIKSTWERFSCFQLADEVAKERETRAVNYQATLEKYQHFESLCAAESEIQLTHLEGLIGGVQKFAHDFMQKSRADYLIVGMAGKLDGVEAKLASLEGQVGEMNAFAGVQARSAGDKLQELQTESAALTKRISGALDLIEQRIDRLRRNPHDYALLPELRAMEQVAVTLMNDNIRKREIVQIKDKVREIKYRRVLQTFCVADYDPLRDGYGDSFGNK
jgi:hypothetical protein